MSKKQLKSARIRSMYSQGDITNLRSGGSERENWKNVGLGLKKIGKEIKKEFVNRQYQYQYI